MLLPAVVPRIAHTLHTQQSTMVLLDVMQFHTPTT